MSEPRPRPSAADEIKIDVDIDTDFDTIDFDAIDRSRLMQIIAAAPKAELHIHIEGSLEPELIFELAQRNGVTLAYESIDALRRAYQFTNLQSFLDIYYAGASVLITADDFRDMAMAYFARAAADHVVHAEIFFDPQTHTARGIAIGTVIEGLHRGCADALERWGITSSLILCFLRHLDEESAIATLESALPWRDMIAGVGLDSSERGHPPEKFARVFERARAWGMHAVAHAGEEGPPAYITTALDALKVERIDHGVRCIEDPALVDRLARLRIPLTVCPLSNVKLRVFDTMADHNIARLLDAGLCITINSDDPAYFGGYVNDNYRAVFDSLPSLTARDGHTLLRNSFEASFIDEATKTKWMAEVDEIFRHG